MYFIANAKREPPKLTNEKKLIQHLKQNYPIKWGRPVIETNQTLIINFALILFQILELVCNVFVLYFVSSN